MKILKNFINKRILIGIKKNNNSNRKINSIVLQKKLLKEIENKNNFEYKFGIFPKISPTQIKQRSRQIAASMIIVRLHSYIYFFLSLNKGLIYPLPKEYLKIIEGCGIKINFFGSNLFCKILIIFKFFHGLINILIFSKKISAKKNKVENKISEKSIFFLSLPIMFTSKNKLIIDEKLVSKIFNLKVDKIYLHKKFKHIEHPKIEIYPKIYIFNYLKFLKYSILSLMDFRKIDYFLYLKNDEVIETIFFEFSSNKSLYKNIVFSEEYRFTKPLWAYYLENLNWKVLFINFSTNHHNQIKFYPNNYKAAEYKYFSFTNNIFPTVDLLNYYMEKSDNIKSTNNNVSDYIFNLTNKFNKKLIKRSVITIYDVPVYHRYVYAVKPWGFYYYKPSVINNFLIDIIECLNKFNNLVIIIKRKSKTDNIVNKFDRNIKKIIQKKVNKSNRLFIIEDVNIFKSIKKTDLVITIPFSSPSVIANCNDIPSLYYDPSGLLQNPFSNQFPRFISSKNELLGFFRDFIKYD